MEQRAVEPIAVFVVRVLDDMDVTHTQPAGAVGFPLDGEPAQDALIESPERVGQLGGIFGRAIEEWTAAARRLGRCGLVRGRHHRDTPVSLQLTISSSGTPFFLSASAIDRVCPSRCRLPNEWSRMATSTAAPKLTVWTAVGGGAARVSSSRCS